MKFSHVVAEDTPKGIGANLFQRLLEQRLPGTVRVEVYPKATIYDDDTRLFDALRKGEVHIAVPSLAKNLAATGNAHKADIRPLQVFELPFLFGDLSSVHRFQTSETGRKLLTSVESQGLKGLAYWDSGMRVISANKPLQVPIDTREQTFRIEPSSVQEAQFAALGAATERLPFSMVYEALETGLVDGQQNTWSNIGSMHFHEVQSDFTETNHSYHGYMVITGAEFWDGLPHDIQREVQNVLSEVTDDVNRIALELNDSYRQEVIDSRSATVRELTAEEQSLWRKELRSVWTQFETEIGTDVIDAALEANN